MSFRLAWRILSLSNEIDERDRNRQVPRRQFTADPFSMSNREFLKTYRLTKPLTQELITKLSLYIPRERRSDGLSVQSKVLITLAFFASGSYQTLVGQSRCHSVSQSTVSRAIRQVTKALNIREIFTHYIQFPMTREARDQLKRSFYRKYKLPGVIGCIDGTHVAIIRPSQHEERYFNRKGYHSLNVMVICDADLNILCIDPSKPGATHDSAVWSDHPLQPYLNQIYNEEEQIFLLGDSGYALRKTIMTPVLNSIPGSPEEHYYKIHVSARNTVERCIGVLKARFRCLLAARVLHYDPVFSGQIVNACALLHNIANRARLPVPQLTPQEREHEEMMRVRRRAAEADVRAESLNIMAHGNRRVNRDLLEGRAVQQALINRLWLQR